MPVQLELDNVYLLDVNITARGASKNSQSAPTTLTRYSKF